MKRIYLLILATVLVASISFSQSRTNVVGTYYKEFVATDSILCISASSHAANTVQGNSATAGSVNWLKFLNVSNIASGNIILSCLQVSSDSLSTASGVIFLYSDTTKIAKIADNAQNIFASESFPYRVADLSFSLVNSGAGTGSTGVYGVVDNMAWHCIGGADKNIYGKIVWTSAYVPKFNGYIRIRIKGWQEVIVP